MESILQLIADYAWAPPSIILLFGTGIYLTIRLKLIQVRELKQAVSETFKSDQQTSEAKNVSKFQALATVLSGTIGTGNIAGVATALAAGGAGSIFWMWMTAIFGMALKFSSSTLAHYYREVDEQGNIVGGPMVTLKRGLGMPKLAAMFAIFTILASFSTGAMVQTNSIVDGIGYIVPSLDSQRLILGLIIGVVVGVVIIGGIQRIAHMATVIVPFMAIAYCVSAIAILAINYQKIPGAFYAIFEQALNWKAVGGAALWLAIRNGVARGLFASEAGLGTAPIGLAAAKADHSVEAGLVGMLGPVIDTLTICTMTALVILVTGYGSMIGLDGAPLSAASFKAGLEPLGANFAHFGAWVVGFGLVFFAYTTIVAWAYYGDRNIEFLFGAKYVNHYRMLFIALIVIGACAPMHSVWSIADIANVGMAIPNLICILLLAGKVKELTEDYFVFRRQKRAQLAAQPDVSSGVEAPVAAVVESRDPELT